MVTCSPAVMGLRARTEKVKESMSQEKYALGAQLRDRGTEVSACVQPYICSAKERKISITCDSCEKRWPRLQASPEGLSQAEDQ